MSSTSNKALTGFKETIHKIKSYEEALGVLYWDMRTGAPRNGLDTRSEVIGALSGDMFQLSTSPQLGEWLSALEQQEAFSSLSEIDQKLVSETRKDYDRSVKIPQKLYKEYVIVASQSESKWEEAKENNDFAGFQPYLEKVISYTNQFIDLWGAKATRYDTLLDEYEPGITVAQLDQLFGDLRADLVPLVEAVAASSHQPETAFLKQSFSIPSQKAFSTYILNQMGFSFESGRLDESIHPFATGLNPGDVRVTTRYLENDVTSALFGTIHEGGHALYEQNISKELIGTTLCTGTTMGIHESQSRFWENVIGRSKPFWQHYYKELQNHFPGQLHVSADQFYRGINAVQPTLIRIDADELTYNLHIIIRYEMEKLIFNEGARVSDLPAIWNDKYKEYLGLTPQSDKEGILQDVHWPGGAFGYFPSYSLGNMYAAQLTDTMERELPELWSNVASGNMLPIKQWLTERIYQYGKLRTPSEIIESVTGKPLDPKHLVAYLTNKYKDIYQIP